MTLIEFIKKIYFDKSIIKKNLLLILLLNFFALIVFFYNHSFSKFADKEQIIYDNVPINITKDVYQNLPFRDLVSKGLEITVEKDELGFQVWSYIFSSPNQQISDKTIELFNKILADALNMQKSNLLAKKEVNNNDKYLLKNILNYENINLNKKTYHVELLTNNRLHEILSIFIQFNIFAIIIIFLLRINNFKKF